MPDKIPVGEPLPNPLFKLWEQSYPFAYWDNRIQKINSYNPQDKLEAVFTLLQLTDTYVTILSARLRNPYESWLMVVDNTYKSDIDESLEPFTAVDEKGREYTDLGQYDGDITGIIGMNMNEVWLERYDHVDFFIADFLGCPATVDLENVELGFLEDPDVYLGVVNGVINFWREHYPMLNDLKHGFRLLPFDWEMFESMLEEGLLQDSNFDMDGLRDDYLQNANEDAYFWRLELDEDFDEVDVDSLKDGEDTGINLVVYRADFDLIVEFSKITLRLLYNLFGRGGDLYVTDMVDNVDVHGTGEVQLFESFIQGPIKFGVQ